MQLSADVFPALKVRIVSRNEDEKSDLSVFTHTKTHVQPIRIYIHRVLCARYVQFVPSVIFVCVSLHGAILLS